MQINLKNRHLLTLLDYSQAEIYYLLNLSADFKQKKAKRFDLTNELKGYNIALLFQKDSTRTRCAFEVAAYDLGMHCTYLGPTGSQIGNKESIEDTAKVLGRMYDGIQFRGYRQSDVESLAKFANVPVWNGLTDLFHPTQMLADMLTIQEAFETKKLAGFKMVYFGDARFNMANSYLVVCAKLGINLVICAPASLMPNPDLLKQCQTIAQTNGSSITVTEDAQTAAIAADVIATDVWVSMGEPKNVWKERIKLLTPYQVNQTKINQAKPNVIFLHCLPSFHNQATTTAQTIIAEFGGNGELEVTNQVFQSPNSKVFNEAENRLHTIKAVLYATLKGS